MNTATPRTIDEYLEQLRIALRDADPALIQDALYDAEEHLRAEMAENPQLTEAALLAKIAGSYGAPDEVAEIYRDKEYTVQQALRSPPPPRRASLLGRFCSVGADPRSYASLFYMLLALPKGIVYFVFAVVGTSLSLGFSVLVIGIPFATLFLAAVRALSLVEGRIVEVMLGVRMPRRPLYASRGKPLLTRAKEVFTDPRTWSTLFYMVMMLPLGILYFVIAVVGLSFSLALTVGPLVKAMTGWGIVNINEHHYAPPLWAMPFTLVLGLAVLFGLLHLARGVGQLQGALAKHLLVPAAG